MAAMRSAPPTAAALIHSGKTLVVAHRGDSRKAPENTIPAFRAAVQLGVDLVELDYQHTSDGVPVVFHDELLDRTTDARRLWGGARIPLASKSLAELRALDAGAWFGAAFAGTPIPTLGEVLDAVGPATCLMIERKSGDALTCWRVLQEHAAARRVTVQAFDWEFLAQLRQQAPSLPLGALGHKELTPAALESARRLGVEIVNWEAAHLDVDAIAAVHRAGLRAWAWTVDDLAEARRLLAAGIDALISNVPAAIQQVVAGG